MNLHTKAPSLHDATPCISSTRDRLPPRTQHGLPPSMGYRFHVPRTCQSTNQARPRNYNIIKTGFSSQEPSLSHPPSPGSVFLAVNDVAFYIPRSGPFQLPRSKRAAGGGGAINLGMSRESTGISSSSARSSSQLSLILTRALHPLTPTTRLITFQYHTQLKHHHR